MHGIANNHGANLYATRIQLALPGGTPRNEAALIMKLGHSNIWCILICPMHAKNGVRTLCAARYCAALNAGLLQRRRQR
jgi:hypothetical protein